MVVHTLPTAVRLLPTRVRSLPKPLRWLTIGLRWLPRQVRPLPMVVRPLPKLLRSLPTGVRSLPTAVRWLPTQVRPMLEGVRWWCLFLFLSKKNPFLVGEGMLLFARGYIFLLRKRILATSLYSGLAAPKTDLTYFFTSCAM